MNDATIKHIGFIYLEDGNVIPTDELLPLQGMTVAYIVSMVKGTFSPTLEVEYHQNL